MNNKIINAHNVGEFIIHSGVSLLIAMLLEFVFTDHKNWYHVLELYLVGIVIIYSIKLIPLFIKRYNNG